MKKVNLVDIGMKAIIEIQTAVRKISKKEPALHKKAPDVIKETLNEAADLSAKIDVLESQLKALYAQYEPLRDEILDSLPGEDRDKVEVFIDGIQLKKYSQVRGGGKLNQEKALNLARNKKLIGMLTKKVVTVDEDMMAVAVAKGLITDKEYASCLDEGKVIKVLKVERKFNVSVDPEIEKEVG